MYEISPYFFIHAAGENVHGFGDQFQLIAFGGKLPGFLILNAGLRFFNGIDFPSRFAFDQAQLDGRHAAGFGIDGPGEFATAPAYRPVLPACRFKGAQAVLREKITQRLLGSAALKSSERNE